VVARKSASDSAVALARSATTAKLTAGFGIFGGWGWFAATTWHSAQSFSESLRPAAASPSGCACCAWPPMAIIPKSAAAAAIPRMVFRSSPVGHGASLSRFAVYDKTAALPCAIRHPNTMLAALAADGRPAMRLDGKIAVIFGAGQSPGEGIGNGRAT